MVSTLRMQCSRKRHPVVCLCLLPCLTCVCLHPHPHPPHNFRLPLTAAVGCCQRRHGPCHLQHHNGRPAGPAGVPHRHAAVLAAAAGHAVVQQHGRGSAQVVSPCAQRLEFVHGPQPHGALAAAADDQVLVKGHTQHAAWRR
jgi:hypothetical protein